MDVGLWSLAALAGYLVVLAVPILMVKLLTNVGSNRPAAGAEVQVVGRAVDPTESKQSNQVSSPTGPAVRIAVAPAGAPAGETETAKPTTLEQVPPMRKMKRSRHILAFNMLLQSGNLISTPLGLQMGPEMIADDCR